MGPGAPGPVPAGQPGGIPFLQFISQVMPFENKLVLGDQQLLAGPGGVDFCSRKAVTATHCFMVDDQQVLGDQADRV